MDELLLVNKEELETLEKVYYSTNEVKRTFFSSKIPQLNDSLSKLNIDDFDDTDYSLIEVKKHRLNKYIEKTKSDLMKIQEMLDHDILLSKEYQAYLLSSFLRKKCFLLYNEFWFLPTTSLKIDLGFRKVLNEQDFFEKSKFSDIDIFTQDYNIYYKRIHLDNGYTLKISKENESILNRKIELINDFFNASEANKNLILVATFYVD